MRDFLLFLVFAVAFVRSAAAGPAVTVDGETLLGSRDATSGVYAFKGIPFAAPPVGDLRWRAPQDYVPEAKQRDATRFAPACMQTPGIVEWYRDLAELSGADRDVVSDLSTSEDCLYLNVWTPELDSRAKLPVMVYIHGGGNSSGWSYEPNYHGDVLATEGVVVVSIGYRLGDFGFFSHPALSGQRVSANFGLFDQVAALEWVQAHIARFGGDATRVTVFGESAGGENIVALMFAQMADELFHRAILQSSAGFLIPQMASLDDEQRRGSRLAEALRAGQPMTIAELRSMPAEEFLLASEAHSEGHYHSPVVDGVLVSEPVLTRLQSGEFPRRPVIVGTNADEYFDSGPENAGREDVEAFYADYFGAAEFERISSIVPAESPGRMIGRLRTVAEYHCPSQHFAGLVSAAGSEVWMYLFSRAREGNVGKDWGAYHGTELPYVFGTHDAWLETTAVDREITRRTMGYWIAFASAGDPNGEPDAWPKYAAPAFVVLEFGDTIDSVARPYAGLCRIYSDGLSGPAD